MKPCNHEESDTRITVQLVHAFRNGCKSALVQTGDTDVLVILLSNFHILTSINEHAEIWVQFKTSKSGGFKRKSVGFKGKMEVLRMNIVPNVEL